MKILKKGGGSREKGGGENEIHAPCACGFDFWTPTASAHVASASLYTYCRTFMQILSSL